MHGGVKFYRGAPRAARAYVERDRSRADDYYLAEGSGVATRLIATPDGARSMGGMTGEVLPVDVAGLGQGDEQERSGGEQGEPTNDGQDGSHRPHATWVWR